MFWLLPQLANVGGCDIVLSTVVLKHFIVIDDKNHKCCSPSCTYFDGNDGMAYCKLFNYNLYKTKKKFRRTISCINSQISLEK